MGKVVSIIVPIYNVEKYLKDCVDTLINQSYSDLEIILVDDGSTDKSRIICDELSNCDSRIRVIHKENGGLSDARNKGIDIATGYYILLVDSDDMLEKHVVEYMVATANEYQADIVCVQNMRCSSDEKMEDLQISNKEDFIIYSFTGSEKMKELLIGNHINTAAWAKLYKNSLFQTIRYPFGKYHEDVFTTYLLVDRAQKVVTSSYIGYMYRINENSITGRAFTRKRLDSIEGKIEQASFIKEHYPELESDASASIIYACNVNLSLMAKANYYEPDVLDYLQNLYNRYWKCYINSKVSIQGKCIALMAKLNVKFAMYILKWVEK